MRKFKELYEEDLYCGDEELDKVLDELTEFRVIGKAQRRKIARRMARLVKTASFKKKVERAKKKIASLIKRKIWYEQYGEKASMVKHALAVKKIQLNLEHLILMPDTYYQKKMVEKQLAQI